MLGFGKRPYICVTSNFFTEQIENVVRFDLNYFQFFPFLCVTLFKNVQLVLKMFTSLYIISPDESRGYIGFRSVAPPPPPP